MSETKRELSERVASLVEQFATLDTNHKDINALLAKLNTELNTTLADLSGFGLPNHFFNDS